MSYRPGDGWESKGRGEGSSRGLGPLWSGLIAATLIALTLMVAVALGMEEQELIAAAEPSTTNVAVLSTAASVAPSTSTTVPASVSATEMASPVPQPTLTASAVPSPTPSPTTMPTSSGIVTCQLPAGWRVISVRGGQTLKDLAWRYKTTERALVTGNCLVHTRLLAGQRLYVPNVAPRPTCGRPPGWVVAYKVRRGDTLHRLAVSTGTTVPDIMNANCLRSTIIYIGQTLYLPRTPRPTSPPPPRPTRTPWPTAIKTATTAPTSSLTVTPAGSQTPTPTGTDSTTPEPTAGTPTAGTPTKTTEPTGTIIPPTETSEPPGTATNTPFPPTATPTDTSSPPTGVPTNTPVPPTVAPTATSIPTKPPPPPTDPPPPTNPPPPPTNPPAPTSATDAP